jgi:hypothetical protein
MTASRASAFLLALACLAAAGDVRGQTNEPIDILPEVTGSTDEATTSGAAAGGEASEFEVEEAGAIGAEASGVLGEGDGGLGADMWTGSDRAAIESLLSRLAPARGSPTLRELGRRLLLTAAAPPAGEPGTNFLALRLERLRALGLSGEGLGGGNDPAVAGPEARARFEEALARGAFAEACAEPENALRIAPDVEWRRALVACQLVAGKPEAARLGLAVLVEGGTPLPAGFAPLVEAVADGRTPDAFDPAGATILDVALARWAGAALPFETVETRDPAILRLLAGPETQPEDVRLAAAEAAVALAVLPAEALGAAYDSAAFAANEIAEAGEEDVYVPRERALLYQAARQAGAPGRRAELIAAAMGAAREGGGPALQAATARLDAALITGILPTADMAWFAPVGLRVALGADNPGMALAWWRLATERASADPTAPEVALMWPLARLAGLAGPAEGDRARLLAWWEAAAATRDAPTFRSQADAFAALLAAFGDPLGLRLAGRVAAEPVPEPETPATRVDPVAALVPGIAQAAAAGRVGETVLLALLALGWDGPAADPAVLGAAIHGLARVGLDREARRLALEGALAHGL